MVCKKKKERKRREEFQFYERKSRREERFEKLFLSLSLSDYYLSGFLRITILIIDTNIENLFKTISVD